MKNNGIQSPEELFQRHDELVYAKLINPQKLNRFKEVLDVFSDKLYGSIDDRADGTKFGTKYYTSEIRGFFVKMANVPTIRSASERTIVFESIYIGSNAGIGPIMQTTLATGENGELIKWFDSVLREYLGKFGWHCGIFHNKEDRSERFIVYSVR